MLWRRGREIWASNARVSTGACQLWRAAVERLSPFLFSTEGASHERIRQVNVSSGVIEIYGGTGERGDGPEPNPLRCRLSRPHGVFVDAAGSLYVGDSEAHRIRVMNA
jgi:hypothetical protein